MLMYKEPVVGRMKPMETEGVSCWEYLGLAKSRLSLLFQHLPVAKLCIYQYNALGIGRVAL